MQFYNPTLKYNNFLLRSNEKQKHALCGITAKTRLLFRLFHLWIRLPQLKDGEDLHLRTQHEGTVRTQGQSILLAENTQMVQRPQSHSSIRQHAGPRFSNWWKDFIQYHLRPKVKATKVTLQPGSTSKKAIKFCIKRIKGQAALIIRAIRIKRHALSLTFRWSHDSSSILLEHFFIPLFYKFSQSHTRWISTID